MRSALDQLGREELAGLVAALRGSRMRAPFHASDVEKVVSREHVHAVTAELRGRNEAGMSAEALAWTIDLLRAEKERRQVERDGLELVWTGPNESDTGVRATAVVVRDLFASARRSVLVSTYVFDGGAKGNDVWRPLAENLAARPALSVRIFVNVKREWKDTCTDAELLRRMAHSFREAWPGERLPAVFYDPRALDASGPYRPVLHAKCVVVDDERAFVTSANFTEAAHERNLEAGVLVSDAGFARALRAQFEALVLSGALRPLPGL